MRSLLIALSLLMLASPAMADNLYANDGTFLGNTNNQFDPNSIYNQFGKYGSQYSSNSINNQYGAYGSPYSMTSPTNQYAPSATLMTPYGPKKFGGNGW